MASYARRLGAYGIPSSPESKVRRIGCTNVLSFARQVFPGQLAGVRKVDEDGYHNTVHPWHAITLHCYLM